jgi:molybdate transport system substrate-binding protein
MLKALLLLLLIPPAFGQTKAVELRIAAAADLQPVLEVLGPVYEKKSNVHLSVSYAASSILASQIISAGPGGPFDVFMGADFYFPEKIVAANLADTGGPIPYARGTLVLWTRNGSPFTPLQLAALESSNLKSLAIADPEHAPYGRAAVEALKKLRLEDKVKDHLVRAENVGQAGQFAFTGNAELAIISKTLAVSPRFKQSGTFVLFPFSSYTALTQTAVVMRNAAQRDAAHAFLIWFLSKEVQQQLPELGLTPVN